MATKVINDSLSSLLGLTANSYIQRPSCDMRSEAVIISPIDAPGDHTSHVSCPRTPGFTCFQTCQGSPRAARDDPRPLAPAVGVRSSGSQGHTVTGGPVTRHTAGPTPRWGPLGPRTCVPHGFPAGWREAAGPGTAREGATAPRPALAARTPRVRGGGKERPLLPVSRAPSPHRLGRKQRSPDPPRPVPSGHTAP